MESAGDARSYALAAQRCHAACLAADRISQSPTHNRVSVREADPHRCSASSRMADSSTGTPLKAKETHEQKALRLKHRSIELRSRGLRLKIVDALHTHEWALQGVAEHLRDVGALDANFEVMASAAGAKKKKGGARKVQEAPGQTPLNRNFTKLSNMPLNHMRDWLQKMEPVVFSENNSKSIVVRGQLQSSRERLSQCFEFMTGIDPETPLFETGRGPEHLASFMKELKTINMARGRVAHDLVLPADWAKQGYFEIDTRGPQYMLHARYHRRRVPLPVDLLQGVSLPEHLSVHMNFSERRAIVKGPGATRVCRDLFLEQIGTEFSMPEFKGPSLTNGEVADQSNATRGSGDADGSSGEGASSHVLAIQGGQKRRHTGAQGPARRDGGGRSIARPAIMDAPRDEAKRPRLMGKPRGGDIVASSMGPDGSQVDMPGFDSGSANEVGEGDDEDEESGEKNNFVPGHVDELSWVPPPAN